MTYAVRSHLGAILRVGDLVLGYDLVHSTVEWSGIGLASAAEERLPEVVLVKKKFRVSKRVGQSPEGHFAIHSLTVFYQKLGIP